MTTEELRREIGGYIRQPYPEYGKSEELSFQTWPGIAANRILELCEAYAASRCADMAEEIKDRHMRDEHGFGLIDAKEIKFQEFIDEVARKYCGEGKGDG